LRGVLEFDWHVPRLPGLGDVDWPRWIDTLREWQEILEPEEIVVRLRYFHGPGLDVAVDSMRMIADEVMPAFR